MKMMFTNGKFSVLLVLLVQQTLQGEARTSPLWTARAAGVLDSPLTPERNSSLTPEGNSPLTPEGSGSLELSHVIPRADVEEAYQSLAKMRNKQLVGNVNDFFHPVPEDIVFQLYTNKNPDEYQRLVAADPDSLKKSHFNRKKQTVVIVHGFLENVKDSAWLIDMKASFLKKNSNVILVDWGKIADGGVASYFLVVKHVPFVGEQLAELFKAMKKECDLSEKKLYLVGFSLGAHVSGFAGKHFDNIARITGLDPAGPEYEKADDKTRLCASDAKFVDIIHTDMGLFGHPGKLGHVDFYVNGGKDQNCGQFCSHGTSHDYYYSSILSRPVKGYQCDNESSFEAAECLTRPSNNFGYYASRFSPGDYYMMTINSNMTKTGRLAQLTEVTIQLPESDVTGSYISVRLSADTYAENGFNFSDARSMRVDGCKEQSFLLVSPLDMNIRRMNIEMWSGKARDDRSAPMVLPSVSFKDVETKKVEYACKVELKPDTPQMVYTKNKPCY